MAYIIELKKDGVLEKTITLSQNEEACLEDSLKSIPNWIEGSIRGKVYNCKQRLLKAGHTLLLQDPSITSMPATEDELITAIKSHKDYKTRNEKEAGEHLVVLE